ncbi:hypothetical protein FOCG_17747 [Fusarium oxysporum f. sp. radicis-lycopersici 26381]|nr:hypothetical protein FOCG_17747 [Fusarium oxysporum f. sp. radicis-lycopersici 26381]
MMQEHDPGWPGMANIPGIMLASQYERTGNFADMEEAISVDRRAVNASPEDHPDRPVWLHNLGNVFGHQYERTGVMSDLDEAISVTRQAVAAMLDNHIDRVTCLSNLGINLQSRYERNGAIGDLDDASNYLQMAWNTTMAIPFQRIQTASRCIKLLALQRKIDTAISLGKDVINILPMINTKLFDRTDQQYVVSTFAGIAADIFALLLASDQICEALHFLEKGRAIILGQLIDSRSDVSHLAQEYPKNARRYEELRDEVNTPSVGLEQDAQ